jgi:hypothetical protein
MPSGAVATPLSVTLEDGSGLGTCAQVLPFQRRMSDWESPVLPVTVPTAQALVADDIATAVSLPPASRGLATLLHVLPVHRMVSGYSVEPVVEPTAQALLAEMAATADR